MDKYGNMTKREACYILGIREEASEEQIKRAYRYKAKLYHPDANPDRNTQEYYIRVQKAYECLVNSQNSIPPLNATAQTTANSAMNRNPGDNSSTRNMNNNTNNAYNAYYSNPFAANYMGAKAGQTANPRPAKVYASTATAKANYKRQKENEKEHQKIQKWDEEYKSSKKRQQQMQMYGKEYTDAMTGTSKSKEDEILEKIRAIWLAETIKRQIALDQEHKEVLQRRKLYQAFMQRQMDDEVKE